jgi:ABC-type transporter Mla MlaB component
LDEESRFSLKHNGGNSRPIAKKTTVAKLNFQDNATEFRIEIKGRFAGGAVEGVQRSWRNIANEGEGRFAVDISGMASYDSAGCSLLRDMFRYGAKIVAGTPESLVFLSEISGRPEGILT